MLNLCGSMTDARRRFLDKCRAESEEMVRRGAIDDVQLDAIDDFCLKPVPKKFYDVESAEERVAIRVVLRRGMGHFLEPALLNPRTGKVSKNDGALYSLADQEELQFFGEMVAAYKLRAARGAAAGPDRTGTLPDAVDVPRATGPDTKGPPGAAPSQSQTQRHSRRPACDDLLYEY